jgi:hypothetical protein
MTSWHKRTVAVNIIRILFKKLNHTGQGLKMGTGWDAGWGYVVPL